MGTDCLFDYRLDHGIFLRLEVHQIIGTSEIPDRDSAISFNRRLPHAVPYPWRCWQGSAIFLPPSLGTARRREGNPRIFPSLFDDTMLLDKILRKIWDILNVILCIEYRANEITLIILNISFGFRDKKKVEKLH